MTPPSISDPVRLFLRRIPDPDQFPDFTCFRKATLSIAVDVAPLPDGSLLVTSPDIPELRLTFSDFDRLRDELPYAIEPGVAHFRFEQG